MVYILPTTEYRRGTLKSFTLFIVVKAIKKLNLGHIDQFEIKILKISGCGSRSPNNAGFGHSFLVGVAEDGKKMHQELQRTCTAIVFLM